MNQSIKAMVEDSRQDYGFIILRVLLSLILLVAAGLKGYELATGPVTGGGWLGSRGALIAVVEVELFLGLWLLSGVYSKAAWGVTLLGFTVFLAVSLYKGLSGQASCGCFGTIQINPWYMAAFDLAAIVALIWFRPNWKQATAVPYHRLRITGVALIVLTVGIAGGIAMAGFTPAQVAEDGQVLGDESVVVLEPQAWLGKRFPLLNHIDIGERLTQGRWIVMLYHHDCSTCQEAIPHYEQLASRTAGAADAPRVALVEMPPYAPAGEGPLSSSSACVSGKLNEQREWFATTPTAISIKEGQVLSASEGKQAVHPPGAGK